MQTKAINPYPIIAAKHKEVLDFLVINLPPDPTFENYNDVLVSAIFTPGPSSPLWGDAASIMLDSILPFAYNGYISGGLVDYMQYTSKQVVIVNKLLNGIKSVPVEAIGDFVSSIDETIANSELSYEEQVPLYIATASAKSDYEYWMVQLANPGGTWAAYLDVNPAINYLHVAGWISAAVEGALLTYGLVKPPQIQLLDIVSAGIGSVGLAGGKVVFGWVGVG